MKRTSFYSLFSVCLLFFHSCLGLSVGNSGLNDPTMSYSFDQQEDSLAMFSLVDTVAGGSVNAQISKEIAAQCHLKMREFLPQESVPQTILTPMQKFFTTLFLDIDTEINKNIQEGDVFGATALIAAIKDDVVYTVNLGDSRAVVACFDQGVDNGDLNLIARDLTQDHKIYFPQERIRIEQAGESFYRVKQIPNFVFLGNANNFCADFVTISRGFGLAAYKKGSSGFWGFGKKESALLTEPCVNQMNITGNQAFMIMASGSFWECMDSQAAVDFVYAWLKERSISLNAVTKDIADEVACALVKEISGKKEENRQNILLQKAMMVKIIFLGNTLEHEYVQLNRINLKIKKFNDFYDDLKKKNAPGFVANKNLIEYFYDKKMKRLLGAYAQAELKIAMGQKACDPCRAVDNDHIFNKEWANGLDEISLDDYQALCQEHVLEDNNELLALDKDEQAGGPELEDCDNHKLQGDNNLDVALDHIADGDQPVGFKDSDDDDCNSEDLKLNETAMALVDDYLANQKIVLPDAVVHQQAVENVGAAVSNWGTWMSRVGTVLSVGAFAWGFLSKWVPPLPASISYTISYGIPVMNAFLRHAELSFVKRMFYACGENIPFISVCFKRGDLPVARRMLYAGGDIIANLVANRFGFGGVYRFARPFFGFA